MKVARNGFSTAQPGAAGMKLAATSLLVVMAAVFFLTRQFEPAYPWLAWLKAFAEAAMVGGLADWFAVTALFRQRAGVKAGACSFSDMAKSPPGHFTCSHL